MSLSFREQAAIAIRSIVIRDRAHRDCAGETITVVELCCSPELAAEEAQALATACCAAWGHDFSVGAPRCFRCGGGK